MNSSALTILEQTLLCKRTMAHQETNLQLEQRLMPRLTRDLLTLNDLALQNKLQELAADNPLLEVRERTMSGGQPAVPTLTEHLANQLETMPLATTVRADALRCLGELNERGYLPPVQELATYVGLTRQRAQRAVTTIRSLSPVGVGAHDLADCLTLQLEALPPSAAVTGAQRLIKDHFSALGRGRHDLLPRTGRSAALAVIASLRPSFANNFIAPAAAIEPDLLVQRVFGVWQVTLIAPDRPVQLRAGYADHGGSTAWRLLARQTHALLDALSFRAATLVLVAQALVDRQRAYFEQGKLALVPVRLCDIATDIGLSISTVSATIRHKHLATPGGTIALKYLLQRKTKGHGRLAAAALQEAIKQLVATEDPALPFTDDAIMTKLQAGHGAPARRTIAKHRQRAGILPSNLRRRHVS